MNCIDDNTEVYMMLQKSKVLPVYDEMITERGYDNVSYVEMIRRSCTIRIALIILAMKFGMLGDEFLFKTSLYGYLLCLLL